jgi:hypothetical protein
MPHAIQMIRSRLERKDGSQIVSQGFGNRLHFCIYGLIIQRQNTQVIGRFLRQILGLGNVNFDVFCRTTVFGRSQLSNLRDGTIDRGKVGSTRTMHLIHGNLLGFRVCAMILNGIFAFGKLQYISLSLAHGQSFQLSPKSSSKLASSSNIPIGRI